jgi:hypothetical protein
MNNATKTVTWVNLERFQFADGARFAWVRWERKNTFAERSCIGVSDTIECPKEWRQ